MSNGILLRFMHNLHAYMTDSLNDIASFPLSRRITSMRLDDTLSYPFAASFAFAFCDRSGPTRPCSRRNQIDVRIYRPAFALLDLLTLSSAIQVQVWRAPKRTIHARAASSDFWLKPASWPTWPRMASTPPRSRRTCTSSTSAFEDRRTRSLKADSTMDGSS